MNLGANSIEVGGATDGTFSGSIAGTGGLTKVGAGIETLTGANTYTGGTFINAGTRRSAPAAVWPRPVR